MHKSQIILFAIVISLVLTSCNESDAPLELPSIIGSNMVLQQEQNVKLWGKGQPGKKVSVKASWGADAETKVDASGEWLLEIKTPSAGGPYDITITHANTKEQLTNVLIGEVWLCSGQSNMEMPLMGWPPSDPIMNSGEEIAAADYPSIRFFTVSKAIAATPEKDVTGEWQECTPRTARGFSAVAYFYGRKLHKELGIPIGLIHSSWGGTPAESWVSKGHLERMPDFVETLKSIEESKPMLANRDAWMSQLPTITIDLDGSDPWANLYFSDSILSAASYNHSNWPQMDLPQLWESTEVGQFDGVIWFRRTIQIPKGWEGQELILSLGTIDDMDITYFNGHRVGATEQDGFWQMKREYTIPKELVRGGEATIAVRVLDHQGGGGIYGEPKAMSIALSSNPNNSMPLAGPWAYLPVAEYLNRNFFLFDAETQQFFQRPTLPIDLSAYTPTLLYNAMIAPITNYGIRGAIWYQGESNTGRHKQYQELFPLLIESWRDAWGLGEFPFYYVQIAPYEYGPNTPSQLLREAQLKTLSVPNTGMTVTMDIGNPGNIHPANKVDVSKRLALWALAKTYGHDIEYSGPLYKAMEVKGAGIELKFDYAHDGLKAKDGTLDGFLIAGNDKVFVPAKATIVGDRVSVSSPRVTQPVAVRYAWDNTTEGTLLNGVGLPASSFRTDFWEK